MVVNGLISSMSTVLEMKSGKKLFCTFIYIVNRIVSGEIYTAGENFRLPPAVMAWTNLTSDTASDTITLRSLHEGFPPICTV